MKAREIISFKEKFVGCIPRTGCTKHHMRKIQLSIMILLLALSLAGCMPSFDPEAEQHFNQGIDYRRQQNNAKALQEFSQAIELDPDYSYAYYNRARVEFENGDLESSLTDYNQAITFEPENVYWTLERGFLYLELGDQENARLDFERA